MKTKLKYLALISLMLFIGCSKDDSPTEDTTDDGDEMVDTNYVIVNNGNGGVTTASDTGDDIPPVIAQAVPAVQGETFSNTLPILLFFNDKLLLPSLEDNLQVTQDGEVIGGIITINEGANGYAILTFSPSETFGINKTILFTLSGDIQDDGGNLFGQDYSLSFKTKAGSTGSFDNNTGFESGTQGVEFIGDGNIMNGNQGCVDPVAGNSFAAITSGDQLISEGSAIAGASSLMILGPIEESFSNFNFNYNFMSSEFQEFVDSEFDDSVIVTIVGPDGAYSEFLTSVNTVGLEGNTQCEGFPGLPDEGDEYGGSTGWISKSISNGNIGAPAYIVFTITDVSDTIYSSILALDGFNL